MCVRDTRFVLPAGKLGSRSFEAPVGVFSAHFPWVVDITVGMKEVHITADLDADFVCLFRWHSFPIVIFLCRNFVQWVPVTCSMYTML